MSKIRLFCSVAMLASVVALVGCGEGGPARSPVTGKVTAKGEAVKGGSLTFAPVTTDTNAATSPVIAQVKEDGTFEVNGGAAAGKHRVMYDPPIVDWQAPEWDGKGAPPQPPPTPYQGLQPQVTEVDFVSGTNDLTIELVPRS